jgi:2-keto-3-deoxy-L-rhamnonate aldolase RhmA
MCEKKKVISRNGVSGEKAPSQFADTRSQQHDDLQMFLFTTDVNMARAARQAGVDGFVVDWEINGKEQRQRNHNLQINYDTPEDVIALARSVDASIVVRINAVHLQTHVEVEQALDVGATHLMLPMARRCGEVERFLRLVDRRAVTIVQIETVNLTRDLDAFSKLPWDYAYIGLNDLMLSRGRCWPCEGIQDGTVEWVVNRLSPRPVGFGGITVVDGGAPVPFRYLFGEMARLDCALSFLRRSFLREIVGREIRREVPKIRALWRQLRRRNAGAIAIDYQQLMSCLHCENPDRAA